VPSNCTITNQIHDSRKAGTSYQISVDNERENEKQIIEELMRLVKNMDINQEKFATDYVKDMRTLYTHMEKRDKEMETMKANHDKEINSMQNKLLTMDE